MKRRVCVDCGSVETYGDNWFEYEVTLRTKSGVDKVIKFKAVDDMDACSRALTASVKYEDGGDIVLGKEIVELASNYIIEHDTNLRYEALEAELLATQRKLKGMTKKYNKLRSHMNCSIVDRII